MKRILRIELNGVNMDFDYDNIKAYYFKACQDGTMAFNIDTIDDGGYLFRNNKSLKIQLIEEEEE
jgi:hypothetical protein